MFKHEIGEEVVCVNATNWDAGISVGTVGFVNTHMEAPDGSRFIMFQPKGTTDFIWAAEWRFEKFGS